MPSTLRLNKEKTKVEQHPPEIKKDVLVSGPPPLPFVNKKELLKKSNELIEQAETEKEKGNFLVAADMYRKAADDLIQQSNMVHNLSTYNDKEKQEILYHLDRSIYHAFDSANDNYMMFYRSVTEQESDSYTTSRKGNENNFVFFRMAICRAMSEDHYGHSSIFSQHHGLVHNLEFMEDDCNKTREIREATDQLLHYADIAWNNKHIGHAYSCVAILEQDITKKIDYFLLAARHYDNDYDHNNYQYAAFCYEKALEIETDPVKRKRYELEQHFCQLKSGITGGNHCGNKETNFEKIMNSAQNEKEKEERRKKILEFCLDCVEYFIPYRDSERIIARILSYASEIETDKSNAVSFCLMAAEFHLKYSNDPDSKIDAARKYLRAVDFETDDSKALSYCLEAIELICVARKKTGASHCNLLAEAYEKAAKFEPDLDKREKYFLHMCEEYLQRAEFYYLHEALEYYKKASKLTDKGKKTEILNRFLDIYKNQAVQWAKENRFSYAASIYKVSIDVAQLLSKDTSELKEKAFTCSILGGEWDENLEEIRAKHPRLHELIQNSDRLEMDKEFIEDLRTLSNIDQVSRVLEVFQDVRKEVGIIPARKESATELLKEGFEIFQESGELDGIPDFFLFQTLAVADDETKLSSFRKLLSTKSLRQSRDDRKAVMWYLEDHREESQHMDCFYKIIEISSGKNTIQNIKSLGILLMIEPEFNAAEIENSEQFRIRVRDAIISFAEKRTSDEKVKNRFIERINELYDSGFLSAIISMYAQYDNYSDVFPAMDIAFAAIVMDDFKKIKFPSPETMNSMEYLTEEQKELLSAATNVFCQLDGKQRENWMEDVRLDIEANECFDEAERTKADVKRKIEEMKFHFEAHLHKREGEFEQDFAFNDVYLKKIEERLGDTKIDAKETIRLRCLKDLVNSVLNIQSIDPLHAKDKEAEIKQNMRTLATRTKTLFTEFYGVKPETLYSLQAKVDIENLREIILGNRARLVVKSLHAFESSDSVHLILAGKEPQNSGSCQRYDGTPDHMIGLSGYLINSRIKIIRVENQDGFVVGRSMLRIIDADGKPALFLEKPYYLNGLSDPNIDNTLIALASKKASVMEIPLYGTYWPSDNRKTVAIIKHEGLSPYEYSDGIESDNSEHGGVLEGRIETSLEVGILYPNKRKE